MTRSLITGVARGLLVIAILLSGACADGELGVEPGISTPDGSNAELTVYVPIAAMTVGRLSVEVSAPDLDTLYFNLALEDGAASGTITLLAGSERTVTLRAFNHSGLETHRGSTTLDVHEGSNPGVSVTLDPLGEGDPMAGIVGDYEILPITSSWPYDPVWGGYLGHRGASVQLTAQVVDGAGDPLDVPVHWAGPGITSTGMASAPEWEEGRSTMTATVTAVAGTRARQASVVFQDWAPIGSAVAIHATYGSTCAINTEGALFCWGDHVLAPSPVAPDKRFTDVAVGTGHACAVDTDGAAWCWGAGTRGQLGDGSDTSSIAPVRVSGELTFTDVAVGNVQAQYSCGLTATGEVWCWGNNDLGQLGNGTQVSSPVPVKTAADQQFRSLEIGFAHACAITVDDAAYCWGNNFNGKVGNGTFEMQAAPVAVAGGHQFATLSTGTQVTCGLNLDGELYCWGGQTLWSGNSATPVLISTGHTFVDIDVGHASFHHICAITAAGEGYCWGENSDGQLGIDSSVDQTAPASVSGGLTFSSVTTGGTHSCSIAADGDVFCWGDNRVGELGTLSRASSAVPVAVAEPTTASIPVP